MHHASPEAEPLASESSSAHAKLVAKLESFGLQGSSAESWRCPAHDDQKPSLSVSPAEGKVLVKCHAGCELSEVLDALGLSIHDLFDHPSSEEMTTYDYTDASGDLVFQVVRRTGKKFSARCKGPGGAWEPGTGNSSRPLYRLPAVIAAIQAEETIYVVEGEKDADRLADLGFPATCNPFGAGKWLPQHTESLAGTAKVVVVADDDPPGVGHAAAVASSLATAGIAHQVVKAQVGNDVSDHLDAGKSLQDLVEFSPEAASKAPKHRFVPIGELLAATAPSHDWLVEGRPGAHRSSRGSRSPERAPSPDLWRTAWPMACRG